MPSTRRASAQHTGETASDAPRASASASTSKPSSSKTKSASHQPSQSSSERPAEPAPSGSNDEPSTDAHIELLTEHFGFSPKAFVDALVFLANEHLYRIAEQFEVTAVQQLQHLEGGDLEAEQGVHAVLTLFENALDHTLDTFELYCLRSVFGVKPSQAKLITLDHHRGLDLRPKNSSEAAPTASKGGRSRKSAAASASSAPSANERSHQLGAEEDALKRKLAAARSVQHDLLLAKQAAELRLSRTTLLQERFSALLSATNRPSSNDPPHPDGGPALTAVLGHHARKLRMDAEMLLKNLESLRSEDPLGKPLVASSAVGGKVRERDQKESESGEEEGASELRVWERGREAYLNWEAERMVAKVKGAAPSGDSTDAADETMAAEGEDGKTPKRRRTALAAPGSSRRKAASSDSAAPTSSGSNRQQQLADGRSATLATPSSGEAIGEADEMDKIAAALRQR